MLFLLEDRYRREHEGCPHAFSVRPDRLSLRCQKRERAVAQYDVKYLKQFKGLPPKARAVIALRAAMRVFPVLAQQRRHATDAAFWFWPAEDRVHHTHVICRCVQSSAFVNSLTKADYAAGKDAAVAAVIAYAVAAAAAAVFAAAAAAVPDVAIDAAAAAYAAADAADADADYTYEEYADAPDSAAAYRAAAFAFATAAAAKAAAAAAVADAAIAIAIAANAAKAANAAIAAAHSPRPLF
jgi:hypothetical protein